MCVELERCHHLSGRSCLLGIEARGGGMERISTQIRFRCCWYAVGLGGFVPLEGRNREFIRAG